MKYGDDLIKSWKALQILEKGLTHHHTQCRTIRMRKANGEKAKTHNENAKLFSTHFGKLFNNQSPLPCDPTALDLINQVEDFTSLDDPISLKEVRDALKQMANRKAAGPSSITSDVLKSM
eukprot:10527199-Ditylum_brightwellii.AAC.1